MHDFAGEISIILVGKKFRFTFGIERWIEVHLIAPVRFPLQQLLMLFGTLYLVLPRLDHPHNPLPIRQFPNPFPKNLGIVLHLSDRSVNLPRNFLIVIPAILLRATQKPQIIVFGPFLKPTLE